MFMSVNDQSKWTSYILDESQPGDSRRHSSTLLGLSLVHMSPEHNVVVVVVIDVFFVVVVVFVVVSVIVAQRTNGSLESGNRHKEAKIGKMSCV